MFYSVPRKNTADLCAYVDEKRGCGKALITLSVTYPVTNFLLECKSVVLQVQANCEERRTEMKGPSSSDK